MQRAQKAVSAVGTGVVRELTIMVILLSVVQAQKIQCVAASMTCVVTGIV